MEIDDDIQLLDLMVADGLSAKGVYRPGPYWVGHTREAVRQIKKFGIKDFRGSSNAIGLSFTDSVYVDASVASLTKQGRAAVSFMRRSPLKNTYDRQFALTLNYWGEFQRYRNALWEQSERVALLLDRYTIEGSVGAGCQDKLMLRNSEISAHYLQVLDTHDHLCEYVNFHSKSSFLEIGGGFGSYIHLLVSNYVGLRKFLYLDIAPNLYVGTQYLRALFGDAVKPYSETRNMPEIRFSTSDELEIYCIAPYQLERFVGTIDHFHNAHSFVEMTRDTVANYARLAEQCLSDTGTISLVSYDEFDESTIDPRSLPSFFGAELRAQTCATLTPGRVNYHFTSHQDGH